MRPKIVEAYVEQVQSLHASRADCIAIAGLAVALGSAVHPLAAAGIAGYPVIKVYYDIARKHLRPGPPAPPPPNAPF